MKTKYKTPAANSRLPQWGLKWLIEVQCIYQHSCLFDSLVFQNPPLRQAPKTLCAILRTQDQERKTKKIRNLHPQKRVENANKRTDY
jgi:hypothetical protein